LQHTVAAAYCNALAGCLINVDHLSALYTADIVLTAAVVLVYETNHLIVG